MHHAIREFGYVGTEGSDHGIDYVRVTPQTFKQLRHICLQQPEGVAPVLRFRDFKGKEALQVLNYVGLLQTPNGTQLEILPKTTKKSGSVHEARSMLWHMLRVVKRINSRTSALATVDTLPKSWLEALTAMVLADIVTLVKKGVRSDYVRVNRRQAFLKGQLRASVQMRSRPGTEHQFAVRFDQYLPNRPENRLIKSCIKQLQGWTSSLENARLCRELLFLFTDIPFSEDPHLDLTRWSGDRHMAHYQPLLSWVRLVLADEAPVFSKGRSTGISLLFPMEKLFEEYVSTLLSRNVTQGFRLVTQSTQLHLARHRSSDWFQLRPDILIKSGSENVSVMDVKWKLIDASMDSAKGKYGISQADFYQMYAYGKKYLGGKGNMLLVYPKHEGFSESLPVFEFGEGLDLWVIPFDLQKGCLEVGFWKSGQPWL